MSRDCSDFRRVSLEKNLAPPEVCRDPHKSLHIRGSVVRHLNEICGLKPGYHIADTGVFSLKTNLVLELKTNYRQLVPDNDIDLKPIHTLPSRFPSIFEGVADELTCIC